MTQQSSVEPVSVLVAPAAVEYLQTLIQHGALEGESGNQQLHPAVAASLHAIHVELSGGDQAIVDDLDQQLADTILQTNQLIDGNPRVQFV